MIALSTGSLHTYGTARAIRLAAAAGFDGLEIMIDGRWDTRDPVYLREVARAAALPIVSLHSPFVPDIDGWSTDEVDRVNRTVDLARALGARMVVVHPPLRFRWLRARHVPFFTVSLLTPIPRGPSRLGRWLLDGLDARREDADVTIAVENMPRHRLPGGLSANLFSLNRFRDLERLPAVALDTTHLATWNVTPLQALDMLGDRVVHIHLSNFDGRQHRLLDDGRLELGPFLAALRRRDFRGVIVVELVPEVLGAGDDRLVGRRLAEARAFCRTHFGA
jgi:sugar phosphate isomerase/epimerase